MTAPLLALALSNKLIEIGALAAGAALLGIGGLSLLVFSQARELRRLREWAGRAPERAAELEQRASAEAAMRIQRTVRPVPRPAGVAVVPRSTPVVTRAAGIAGPATQVAGGVAVTAAGETISGQAAATPDQPQPAAPDEPTPEQPAPSTSPVPGQPAFVPSTPALTAAAQAQGEAAAPEQPAPATSSQPAVPVGHVAGAEGAAVNGAPQETPAVAASAASEIAPATVAAATAASASASLAKGPPPAPSPPPLPIDEALTPAPRAPFPPAPSRPVRDRPVPSPPPARAPLGPPAESGGREEYRFLREAERSPRRARALIVAGVAVGVVLLAVVLLVGGGGGNQPARSSAGSAAAANGSAHHARAGALARMRVVVLNATEVNGLAHRLSADLRHSGYTQAVALSARPASARSTSVVEYASGHRADAEHVAQTLGIGEVAPLEEAIGPLAEGASVVVIAGADKASLVGAASEGPPAAG